MKVVIIGGVAGGASAAARLRRLNEHAEIIILERGGYISYANCGLPYYIGGVIKDRARLIERTPNSFKSRFNIDVRTKSEVIGIDRENKTLTVKNLDGGESYLESYDKLIIATGASPIMPDLKGIDSEGIFSLRNVEDTDAIKQYIDSKKPKTAAVIGGGYIGIEMAENLKHLGIDVSIVEMGGHLINTLDYDMAAYVQSYLKACGVKVYLNNKVEAFERHGDTIKVFTDKSEINAELIILSLGVMPDTSLAKIAGLKVNSRDAIITDKYLMTSDSDIYAAGDAVEIENFVTKKAGYIPLAGPANKQGRIVADNISGLKTEYKGSQGSAVIKIFDMTVAVTGINEKTAKSENIDYGAVINLTASHAGYYPGGASLTIKTIFEKSTGRILGAQVIGFGGVDKRCDVLAVAIRAGMTATDLTELDLCYAPPFSSAKDPVNMVGYTIENILSGKVKQFYIEDIENIAKDDGSILLDARTAFEYNSGSIENAVNIPLDNLRYNLHKLDKAKKIYVFCHSGVRSYLANRLLTQNGFDTYNLTGGFSHYNLVKNNS